MLLNEWITNKIGTSKCQQGTSLAGGCLFTVMWLIHARAQGLRFFSQAVTEFGFGSVCLMWSEASLLTPGCDERKYSVYCQTPSKENSQLVFRKLKLVSGFQGRVFKGKEKERVVCNWLMYILLVGWGWGNRMVFQESQVSVFWFPLVWDLCSGGQHVVNFFPCGGFSVCKTTPRYGLEYD